MSCGVRFCTCDRRWCRASDLRLFRALANATTLAVLERRLENTFRLCPRCSTRDRFVAMASLETTASVNCFSGVLMSAMSCKEVTEAVKTPNPIL